MNKIDITGQIDAEDVGQRGWTICYEAEVKIIDDKIYDFKIENIEVTDECFDVIETTDYHRDLVERDINDSDEKIFQAQQDSWDSIEDAYWENKNER